MLLLLVCWIALRVVAAWRVVDGGANAAVILWCAPLADASKAGFAMASCLPLLKSSARRMLRITGLCEGWGCFF